MNTLPSLPVLPRRTFLRLGGLGLAGGCLGLGGGLRAEDAAVWTPDRALLRLGKPLRVQPLFMYRIPEPKAEASWKSWGGVQTEAQAGQEIERIRKELTALAAACEFPVEFLPLAKVKTPAEAQAAQQTPADANLVYPCTGGGDLLRACLSGERDNLIFVRHRSGPVYYWYEALSVGYLQTPKDTKPDPAKKAHVDDVAVDSTDELRWRLRGLFGARNLRGTRIVALGGVWGKYSQEAPQVARDKYRLDIVEASYDDFGRRIASALKDSGRLARAEQYTDAYLRLPKTELQTERGFATRAFVLYELFKELMAEHNAQAFTIKSCMGTVIPMSKTTACLSLSLLNDEGFIALCESDFVIVPAGILLRYLAGRPVFMHNSTFPHQGIVTCAHCTSPRRLDGSTYYPTKLLTHYESEYGAAPKVDMPVGQEVTFIDPEYSTGRWLGFKGTVRDNPFLEICRSQQDVEIQGQWRKLVSEVRDSHWLMVQGDYLKEAGYAARKLGVDWTSLAEPAA